MPNIKLFGAEWCQACKLIKPLLERIGDVEYIDVDSDMEQTAKYGIRNLPTYINMETGDQGFGPVRTVSELKIILGVEDKK